MSLMFRGNFPEIGYYLDDPNDLQKRTKFKCRVESPAGQVFSQQLAGLMDTATGLILVTPTKFFFRPGHKILYNSILYSVSGIVPYIPDNTTQGFIKQNTLVEYVIRCGT